MGSHKSQLFLSGLADVKIKVTFLILIASSLPDFHILIMANIFLKHFLQCTINTILHALTFTWLWIPGRGRWKLTEQVKPGTSQHFDTLDWVPWVNLFLGNIKSRAVLWSVHSYLHHWNQKLHQGVDVLCSDGSTVCMHLSRKDHAWARKNLIKTKMPSIMVFGSLEREVGWCMYLGHIVEI